MNLASVVDGHPEDAVALVARGVASTYGQLRSEGARIRSGLVALGLAPGDRVALIAANNHLFVESYLAIVGAGCIAVPLNHMSPPAELAAQLATTEPRAVIVGPSAAREFAGVDHAVEHVLHAEDVAGLAGPDTPVVDRAAEDVAVLVFTAGTGGAPKAAMLTHGNLHANIRQVQAVPEQALRPEDRVLGALPFFHIYGLNAVLGVALAAGASVVLVERFDPATALDTIRDRGCTIVAGAPTMWMSWAALPGADPDVFAGVRLALSGAAPLPLDVVDVMRARFGVTLEEGYGLTEAAPVVTTSVGSNAWGSIGRPLPGVSIRLVDDGGEDAPLGDPGEILVKGPNVFAGYWNDPAATADVLTADGWLRTGDIAVCSADGSLRIVDRHKDLIIVSGFNVYPAEVEAVLRSHPDVADVAVVGVAHPHTGEAVKAFVVPRSGAAVEEDELIEFCAGRLARYKCPRKVLFVEALPVAAAGKVLRRELRS